MKKWLLVIMVVLILAACGKEKTMAIDFEASTGDQYISFGEINSLKSLGTMTLCTWVKFESATAWAHILDINFMAPAGTGTHGGYSLDLDDGNSQIRFLAGWSGSGSTLAYWDTVPTITPGNEELICVSYDSSSSANDPIIYLNGSPVSTTEINTPSGTLLDTASVPNTRMGFGFTANEGTDTRMDGIMRQVRVYNRILSADEIMQIYNARGADNIKNGLVFCPFLAGAKGLQVFDGATLTTDNLIIDPCSGATGVPTGSPVAIGETYLQP